MIYIDDPRILPNRTIIQCTGNEYQIPRRKARKRPTSGPSIREKHQLYGITIVTETRRLTKQ